MRASILIICLSTMYLISCASSEKQHAQTREVWQIVQQAIERRDEKTAQDALSGLGNYTTVEANDGSLTYFETSKISANVSRIINTLRSCDLGLKSNVRSEIKKCTSERDGEQNHLGVWLSEFSRRYPKTIPLEEKKLTEKFDVANEKNRLEDAALEKVSRDRSLKIRAEEAQALAVANKKAMEIEERSRQHQAYLETPLGQACSADNLIKMAKKTIAEEKAAAKHSGVVDQRRLYGAGKLIEMQTPILSKQKDEFKKHTGKEWSPDQCK